MSTVWITLLKMALSVVITAVKQIPPDRWAQIGGVIAAWLEQIETRLPAGNPLIQMLHFYRARPSMLNRPHDDDE